MKPSSHYVRCCEREIHYVDWGKKSAPALILWHGLVGTGRDFDDLAAALAGDYRIICPDTIGRGLSQWSPEPDAEYRLAFYARLAQTLVDQLGIERMRWLGTSMGGAIGMVAAAGPLKGRISHLILNDIGPALETAVIERIKSYADRPPAFDTVSQLEMHLRTVYQPYGWQSEAQWRRMTETSVRRLPNGQVTTHYDPAMVRQFVVHPNDYDLWNSYDTLDLPTLVLRGEHSDLLTRETAAQMIRRGPRAQLTEIVECGHAPCLNVPHQIELVRAFLVTSD